MTPKGLLLIIYIYFAPSMCPITKQGCRPAKLFAQLQHDIYQIKQTWQSKTDSLGKKKENSQHVQLQGNWIGANLPLGISHIGTRVHRHPQVCIFIWNITKEQTSSYQAYHNKNKVRCNTDILHCFGLKPIHRQQHAHTQKEVTPCLHDHEGGKKNRHWKIRQKYPS